MTKNTKTYALLTVVLIIWGIIGYRIFATLSPDPEESSLVAVQDFRPIEMAKRDTFSIKADYRDPFLGTLEASKPKKTGKPKPVKKEIPTIDVQYTGSMFDGSTKKRIFFVTINGQQFLLEKGKSAAGVTVMRGSEQYLTYRYMGRSNKITLTQ
nr:hypothetical protein [Allomuricauda sp.]